MQNTEHTIWQKSKQLVKLQTTDKPLDIFLEV